MDVPGLTERTPKPEYLIALAPYLGARWYRPHSILDGFIGNQFIDPYQSSLVFHKACCFAPRSSADFSGRILGWLRFYMDRSIGLQPFLLEMVQKPYHPFYVQLRCKKTPQQVVISFPRTQMDVLFWRELS